MLTKNVNGVEVELTAEEEEEVRAEWAANEAASKVERRLVLKSVVIARLTDQQLAAAKEIFRQHPRHEARWYAPDHPAVYADDPDALALLKAIGANPDEIMAP